MKLTVCFGNVKVIVPCGEGDLTVKDLIDKATWRYIKASLEVGCISLSNSNALSTHKISDCTSCFKGS